jgi:hypothetical protein
MRRACFHHKDGSQPSVLSESRYSLFALRFSLEDESISLVILSVIWACGAPIEMKIDHGGTEITEKTLKKLKLRALRVSVVNDFRRSAGAPSLRAGVEGPLSLQKTFLCEIQVPSAQLPNCQVLTAKCQLPTAWLLPCSPSPGSTVCYGDGDQNGFRTLLSQPASKIRADLAGSGWAKVHGILRKSLAPVRIP